MATYYLSHFTYSEFVSLYSEVCSKKSEIKRFRFFAESNLLTIY